MLLSRAAEAPIGRIDRIVLFGSYARGDFRGDSDVDLLALVDRRDAELLDLLYDAVLDAQLAERVDLSLKVVPLSVFDAMHARGEPFACNVEREGKVLWKSPTASASAVI